MRYSFITIRGMLRIKRYYNSTNFLTRPSSIEREVVTKNRWKCRRASWLSECGWFTYRPGELASCPRIEPGAAVHLPREKLLAVRKYARRYPDISLNKLFWNVFDGKQKKYVCFYKNNVETILWLFYKMNVFLFWNMWKRFFCDRIFKTAVATEMLHYFYVFLLAYSVVQYVIFLAFVALFQF